MRVRDGSSRSDDIDEVEEARRPRDEVAEWLRRCPAKAVGSARVGLNPILVDVGASSTEWKDGSD